MYNLYMTYLGDSVEQWMKWGGYKSGGVLTITLGMNNLSGWERTWKNFRKLTKNRTLYYPALHITSFFFLSHLISFFRDTTTIRLCTSLLALLAQLDRALPPFIAKVGIRFPGTFEPLGLFIYCEDDFHFPVSSFAVHIIIIIIIRAAYI